MKFKNKFIIFSFIILIGGLELYPLTSAASALPVFETNPVLVGGQTLLQKITSATTVAEFVGKIARWVKEDLVKALRDVIAKRIIDYIVDQTIVWIQGGGKPKFVTDWDGFLRDAANIAFDQIIKDVGLAWLCSPFKLQVQLSLLPVPKFSQRIECTLDKVVKNIEDFYRDFEKGGWIAYNEAWQPQGNYYGQIIMIHDELLTRTAAKTEAAKNEAQAGGGFLSVKRCKAGGSSTGERAQMEIDAPGSTKSFVKDYKGNYCPADQMEIITPGSTVGQAVASAITSDAQWAANIQSWTAALINAVINRVITEGVGLMKGSGSGGGSSYYPPEYQSAADLEIEQQKQQQTADVKKFINEWQYLFDIKTKSLSYVEQLKVVLTTIKSRNCQPPVSDSEIQTVQTDIDRLKTETTDLKKKIDEGNNLITEITNGNTIGERTIAQQKYFGFGDKYNTIEFQEQVITGSARDAADQEAQSKQTELSNSQARLTTCGISP